MPTNPGATNLFPRPIKLPQRIGDQDPNQRQIEGFSRQLFQYPVCLGATVNATTAALGSPITTVFTWQPPANPLYDRWNFIGPAATQNLRIPTDGMYDFYFLVNWTRVTAITEVRYAIRSAPTSSSGFGAPTFTNIVTGPSAVMDNAHNVIDNSQVVLYRGTELHANDTVQLLVQTVTTVNQVFTIPVAEFRFVYPIPNDLAGQP